MENRFYDIETVNFLLSLSEDELRMKIDEISISQIPSLTINHLNYGTPSLGFASGLGLYLSAQYLNLKNLLYPQKKTIMDIVEGRIHSLRHSICNSGPYNTHL